MPIFVAKSHVFSIAVVHTSVKGQLISEWLFGVFNFQKKNSEKIWWISALELKKWLNQTIKGPFSY